MNLTQKQPPRHTQNNVQVPYGPVKLTNWQIKLTVTSIKCLQFVSPVAFFPVSVIGLFQCLNCFGNNLFLIRFHLKNKNKKYSSLANMSWFFLWNKIKHFLNLQNSEKYFSLTLYNSIWCKLHIYVMRTKIWESPILFLTPIILLRVSPSDLKPFVSFDTLAHC